MISSPSLVDARVHATAVLAALNAALDTPVVDAGAYEYDTMPGSPLNDDATEREAATPDIYVLISLERRPTDGRRQSGTTGRTSWRLAARSVGRNTDECRWAMWRVAVALNGARLVIDGDTTTPVQFESDDAPSPDDGKVSALSYWVYVH